MTTSSRDRGASPAQGRMPVVFAGHGSPMNLIEDNRWSRGFAALGQLVPRPAAILAVSAHWYVPGTFLTGDLQPRTIHDFSGFPAPLYEIQYPAPGKVDLAEQVRDALGAERAALASDWGLDHGTWSVLRWMFPAADIPVVQLSIDSRLAPAQHHELARSLADLRHQGVLLLASGNVVHNLRDAFARMRAGSSETPDWATRYDRTVAEAAKQHEARALIDLWPGSDDGRLAHPSPDHWLPLLYALAATDERDEVRFPTEGFDLGSISMRNIMWG
jgi:4,5-DOPA dioxygenase extradiol